MNLTKKLRDQIVHSIMADMPFDDGAQAARDAALDAAVALLPPKVRAVWDDPDIRGFVVRRVVYAEAGNLSVEVPVNEETFWGNTGRKDRMIRLFGEGGAEAFELAAKSVNQKREDRDALKSRLNAALASVRTVKAFREAYPDLAKYAPAEPEKVANLPATTDLMDTLKAAGLKLEEA
jgi:hypothetical protein